MKSWTEIIAALVLGFGNLVFLTIQGPLVGALSGLIVGIFFSAPILHTLSAFGVDGVTMWQLGATLGFVGVFFKAVIAKVESDV